MAKAEFREAIPAEIVLYLNSDEAQTLAEIFGHVGGDPSTSRRRDADSMSFALRKLGFNYTSSSDDNSPIDSYSGGIYFKENA